MATDNTIYNTARSDGMPQKLAMYIVAQARHETGNYTSHFFTIGNNCFGYSYVPGGQWQLPQPGSNADNGAPTAQYANIKNSVHELTSWIKRRQNEGKFPKNLSTITTPQKYAELLKASGYYGAPLSSYSAALVNWLQQIGNLSGGTSPLVPIAVLIGLYFALK